MGAAALDRLGITALSRLEQVIIPHADQRRRGRTVKGIRPARRHAKASSAADGGLRDLSDPSTMSQAIPKRTGAILWAALAMLSWAGFMLVLQGAVNAWPVGQMGTYSRLLTVVLLLGWVAVTPTGWGRLRPGGRGGWLVLMGVISVLINGLWFAGLQWTSATHASLLFRFDLLFVVIIGAALGLERINRLGLIVAPVMICGLVLLMEVQQLTSSGHMVGDLMIVAAALGLAVNAFIIRHIMVQLDATAVAIYNHAMSGLGFAALAFVEGWTLPANVVADPTLWWWVIAVGAIAAVSLPLYYAALRRMDVWKLRILMLVAPVPVMCVDWLIWGQTLHDLQWLGALLLLCGAATLVGVEARTRLIKERKLTCVSPSKPTH